MRKNGFTLIELLAVIVILAIIALIATPIILGIINDAREESNERSVELYASAVRNGIAAYQLREGKEVLPGTYNESNPLPFKPEYEGKVDCENVIIGEDGKVSLEGCTVNGGEKQYSYGIEQETPSLAGTIGICNPISVATEGTYTAGDKYECDVDPNKEGYDQIFYVLTTPASGATSVNLIMDSNIRTGGEAVKEATPTAEQKGLVAWITQTDYEREDVGGTKWSSYEDRNTFGPITAIEYLQTATEGWTNVNPQTISTFTDDAGETHNMAKTYTVNARMPYYSEISNVSESTLYLIDYLLNDNEIAGRNGVSGVYGYWMLSSDASASFSAWYVHYIGYANGSIVDDDGRIGARPVINLSI